VSYKIEQQQLERYSRQLILPDFGLEAQKKLSRSSVLVIGAGGLGSPCAIYLACSGIGKIGILDSEKVELNNLQRQIMHSMEELGKDKVSSGKHRLAGLNPDIEITPITRRLGDENAQGIIKDFDFIIDASDNFPTRFAINHSCVELKKPFSHAGVIRYAGQTMTILPGKGPCLRCLFPEMPPKAKIPTVKEAGVLPTTPGIIGTIQAQEAIKYFLDLGELLVGRLLSYDALKPEFRIISIRRDPNCRDCAGTG
jgi:molybdopterin/thiamine biosynthesis adenylyltransferase